MGTKPAGTLSNCRCCRRPSRFQTLLGERGALFDLHNRRLAILSNRLTLVNCQDLWMEILAVASSHHVLVDGQPRCLDTKFSGPPETELLHVKMFRMFMELTLWLKSSEFKHSGYAKLQWLVLPTVNKIISRTFSISHSQYLMMTTFCMLSSTSPPKT